MAPKSIKCPICGKAALAEYTPFCSKRCADIDLGRWFRGNYSVPVIEEEDMPDDEGGYERQ